MKTTSKYLILFAFYFVCTFAYGHEDPIGDVHPNVTVNKNGFSIVFYRNEPPDWKPIYYKIDFDIKGKQLGKKKELGEKLDNNDKQQNEKANDEDFITNVMFSVPAVREGDNIFYVQESLLEHKGKPIVTGIINGTEKSFKIDWGEKHINLVHDMSLTSEYFVLLVSQVGEDDFELVIVDRNKLNIVFSRSIGVPVRIYDFPVSSKLTTYKGTVFVAWVESYVDKYRMILSAWDLKEPHRSIRKEILPFEAYPNSHLSMKETSGVAFLAYHLAGFDYEKKKIRPSAIKVIRIDLEERFSSGLGFGAEELKYE